MSCPILLSDKNTLSSCYKKTFTYKGKKFKTVWHCFYYQKFKNTDREWAKKIQNTDSILQVQTMGDFKSGSHEYDPEWNDKQINVMTKILKKRFENENLLSDLMKTKKSLLGENSEDKLWGYKKGTGNNMIGKILMEIRQEEYDIEPEIVFETDEEEEEERSDSPEIIFESEEEEQDEELCILGEENQPFQKGFGFPLYKEKFIPGCPQTLKKVFQHIYIGDALQKVISHPDNFNILMETLLNSLSTGGSIYTKVNIKINTFDTYGFYFVRLMKYESSQFRQFIYGTNPNPIVLIEKSEKERNEIIQEVLKEVSKEKEEILQEMEKEARIKVISSIKMKRKGDEIIRDCDIYVGRKCHSKGWKFENSKWYNPFKLGEDQCSTLDDLKKKYRKYILATPTLIECLGELRGKSLGWIKKDDELNANVLIDLVKENEFNIIQSELRYQELFKESKEREEKIYKEYKEREQKRLIEQCKELSRQKEERQQKINEMKVKTENLYDSQETQSVPLDCPTTLLGPDSPEFIMPPDVSMSPLSLSTPTPSPGPIESDDDEENDTLDNMKRVMNDMKRKRSD